MSKGIVRAKTRSAISGTRRKLSFESLETRWTLAANPVIPINLDWLNAHGPAPYVLDKSDVTYRLDTDVVTSGTAFVVGGKNIELDLNQHVVTYGNAPRPVLNNPDFENGTGRSVPGWNLAKAPKAVIGKNEHYLQGEQVLRIEDATTTQVIVSAPISIPRAQHTYTASFIPGGYADWRTGMQLSVIDKVTNEVLAVGDKGNASRGIFEPVTFYAETTHPVRLQIEITPPDGIPISMDLDQVSLTASFDYGIVATQLWHGELPGHANFSEAAKTAYRVAENFSVHGGSIKQGEGAGTGGTAVLASRLGGKLQVQDVKFQVLGMDTTAILSQGAQGDVVVHNNSIDMQLPTVSNRMRLFAGVKVSAAGGNVRVTANKLTGTGQAGIVVSQNPDHETLIRGNVLRMKSIATNGYGIIVTGLSHFEISNNNLVTTNGRGIIIDGYSSTPTTDGEIFGNYVQVRESPNREYPDLSAIALRMRNNVDAMGAHRNLHVHDNTFIASTDWVGADGAHAARISYANVAGQMDHSGILIENNVFRAISEHASRSATAVIFDGVEKDVDLLFQRNSIESNHVGLRLGQESPQVTEGVTLIGNTIADLERGAKLPFTPIIIGFYNRKVNDVKLIDTIFLGSPDVPLAWAGSSPKQVQIGWAVDLKVTNSTGSPLANALVTITDVQKNLQFTGQTNAQGQIRGVLLITQIDQQPTSNPNDVSSVNLLPLKVKVSLTGYKSVTMTLTNKPPATVELHLPNVA